MSKSILKQIILRIVLPPILYLLNILLFQIICVYFTILTGTQHEPSPCRNHLCTSYATPSPFFGALWKFEAGAWGEQTQS